MRHSGFQTFVAIFVGILLALAAAVALSIQNEELLGSVLGVGALYVIYLVLYLRKRKEARKNRKDDPPSPLLR